MSPTFRPLLCFAILGVAACISADAGPKSPSQGAAETGAPEAWAPDFASCQAWLADQPHSGEAPLCERDTSDDLAQLAADGAARVVLQSGQHAVVWLPADWETRSRKSVLVVLHGTVGCAESTWAMFRRLLSDDHALISLEYRSEDGRYAESTEMQADLDEVLGALEQSCPMEGAQYLMHGVSRGGARAVQLAGLDREGPQRFAGFANDSGTLSPPEFYGQEMDGAHLWLWCGEHDLDPRGGDTPTCAVMEDSIAPAIDRAGGTVDALVVGEGACHGMFGWDCTADCSSCESTARPQELGPGVTAFVAWAEQRLEG